MSRKKPVTLYRAGARDDATRAAKTAAVRAYRRTLADAEFGLDARETVLAALHAGVGLREAAGRVNVSVAAVYGRARWDAEFRDLLDDALDAWSAPRMSVYCGTPTGYRSRRCKCRRCRAAHHAETTQYR